MSYTYMENVRMCTFNDKGFIYRLIEMDEDVPEWAAIDIYFNADLNDGLTQYIGTKQKLCFISCVKRKVITIFFCNKRGNF